MKKRFKDFLIENEMYDVFMVNVERFNLTFDEHIRLVDTLSAMGEVEPFDYIAIVVNYSDGSYYDELNKKWKDECKAHQMAEKA